MRKLILSLMYIFSFAAGADGLTEFSTSMDFDEFGVVIKHLQALDAAVAKEIGGNITQFKSSTAPGKTQRFELKHAPGHMVLEREDDQAFTVAIFTSVAVRKKIDAAYESATKELGI